MCTLLHPNHCLLVLLVMVFMANVVVAQDYDIEEIKVNSQASDFGAVRYQGGIVFCSNRAKKKLSLDEDSTNYYTDMFYARLRPNKSWGNPELFAPELTEFLNEGPCTFSSDYQVIYYTTNIEPKDPNRKDRVNEYKLGIQAAVFNGLTWVKAELFPFNSPKIDYNVAHPALSPNDSILFFTSNIPGGFGGMDLYKCIWSNGRWSQPINLGANINTKGDELFPFYSVDGYFYYTTNGRNERGKKDTDIYVTEPLAQGGFAVPTALPYPMNTEFDDFAYSEFIPREYGMISSNREELDDRIYGFRNNAPHFKDCKENNRPIFCYEIEESRLPLSAGLPLEFTWSLGDGNTKKGAKISHCYAAIGEYDITLTIEDTLTKSKFIDVSSEHVSIREYDQPYIISNDSVLINSPMTFYVDLKPIRSLEPDKIYWIVDDEYTVQADSLVYTFKDVGYHNVVCGILGKPEIAGARKKTCSYKEIFVVPDGTNGFPQMNPDPNAVAFTKIKTKDSSNGIVVNGVTQTAPVFHLVLAESEKKLSTDDPQFASVKSEITEYKVGDNYIYSTGATEQLDQLYPLFTELKSAGMSVETDIMNGSILYTFLSDKIQSLSPGQLEVARKYSLAEALAMKVETNTQPLTTSTTSNEAKEHVTTTSHQELVGITKVDLSDLAQYHIVLFESDESLPLTDVAFSKLNVDIAEFKTSKGNYQYIANGGNSIQTAKALLQQAQLAGLRKCRIMSSSAPLQLDAFQVVLLESKDHMSFDNPIFSKVNVDITEYQATEGTHQYVINAGNDPQAAKVLAEEMVAQGFQDAKAVSSTDLAYSKFVVTMVALEVDNSEELKPGEEKQTIQATPYHVLVKESALRIPFNDPFFSKVTTELSEFKTGNNTYQYLVGANPSLESINVILEQLKADGYMDAKVINYANEPYTKQILNVGMYIEPGNAEQLNLEFSRLRDIKFEYNSDVILDVSKPNLDYIASMLILEEGFEVKINAHTCSMGTHEYNQELSARRAAAVVQYLASKGIETSRMQSKGFAEKQPLADNATENGRKQNRRVEFIIVFSTK